MEKVIKVLLLLLSLSSFNFPTSEGIDLEGLSDDILEDVFNIYSKIGVAIRDTTGQQVIAENIKYYLYNSNDPDDYTIIDASNASMLSNTAPIAIFIHGWLEDISSEWYYKLKKVLFQRNSQYSIIEVDWSAYSTINYFLSQFNTEDVGYCIGDFIATLHTNYGIPLSNILLVGASLGAQVSGFAGKKISRQFDEKLPRIVALDPAGPIFQFKPISGRLDASDAKVVQIIHSNAGGFGYFGSCGTIDFYPNGGSVQRGCLVDIITNRTELTGFVFCDHLRSIKYFIEAIGTATSTFTSKRCDRYLMYQLNNRTLCDDSEEHMGSLETTNIGDYFLNTNSESPYSK